MTTEWLRGGTTADERRLSIDGAKEARRAIC